MNSKRSGVQPPPRSGIEPEDGGQVANCVCESYGFPEEIASGLESVCALASVQAHPTIPIGSLAEALPFLGDEA